MNLGPGANSSIFETGLAVLFVLLVFGVFVFAFAAPIYTYFANHKDRWADYEPAQKRSVVIKVGVTLITTVFLIWFATRSFT